ncbi:putative leucine-rich repeat receptor-like protein kinase [Camellia lanceoleosa]|nr:putative leucine-rich repeat receptor-like protein kinase [Camellia lanceoleosa]
MEVNEKCDVYSFGVLALEVIIGKHPGDLISSVSSSSSSSSTSTAQGIFLKDVLDQRLLPPRNQVAEQVVVVLETSICMLLVNKIFHGNLAPLLLDIYDFSPEFQNPKEPSSLYGYFFKKCKDSTQSSLVISTRGQSSKFWVELAYTMEVNEKCDVYSFRVLALEVIMGKHPGDLISSLSSSLSSSSTSTAQGIILKDVLGPMPPTSE